MPDKATRTTRTVRAAETDKSGKSGKSGKPGRAGKTDRAIRRAPASSSGAEADAGAASSDASDVRTALVVAGFGRHYTIETPAGERLLCHTRGKSRKKAAAVGDSIRWSLAGDEAVIDSIMERRNLLYRQDEMRSKVFVANTDMVLLWLAASPLPGQMQLGKTLVACEAAGIPVQIVLNKADLPQAAAVWQQTVQPLERIGYSCHLVSSLEPQTTGAAAWQTLLQQLHGRRTFVMGPSGAGKSTFINRLVPDARAATREISQALRTGRHTTTSTTLYWLDASRESAVIDSPGFQEFGIQHIAPQQLPAYMPDIHRVAQTGCRFHNCTHLHEPGCCVIQAAQDAHDTRLEKARWELYTRLYAELNAPPRY